MTEKVLKARQEVDESLAALKALRESMLNQEGSIKSEVSSVPLINAETKLRSDQEKLKQLLDLMGNEGKVRGKNEPY